MAHKLMLMLCWLVTCEALAQEFHPYDSTLRALYWRGEYEKLALHTLSGEDQYDYYYQGLYTGVARYQLGHPRQALRYLTQAQQRNDNDTVRNLMAASLLALGRPDDARALSPKASPKGKLLESLTAAGSYRINTPDSVHGPVWSGFARADGVVGKMQWVQTVQYYNLTIGGNSQPKLPVSQWQHYVRLSFRPSYGFSSSVGWHTLYATIDTLHEWSYLGYADWLWHGRFGYLGLSATVGHVNRATVWQGAIQGQFLPITRNTLYLRGQIGWQQIDSVGTAVADLAIGTRIISKIWMEGSAVWPFYGNKLSEYQGIYYYLGNRGEYVYNAGDPTAWKIALTTAFYITPKLKLITVIQTEKRPFSPIKSSYFQNGINLGLSWKF